MPDQLHMLSVLFLAFLESLKPSVGKIDEIPVLPDNHIYLSCVMPGPGLCQKVQLILFFPVLLLL